MDNKNRKYNKGDRIRYKVIHGDEHIYADLTQYTGIIIDLKGFEDNEFVYVVNTFEDKCVRDVKESCIMELIYPGV